MRSPYYFILFGFLVLMACSNKNKVPSGILSQKDMQELVWDIMMAEEYGKEVILQDTLRSKNFKKERSVLYQQVFELHDTNREDFLKSFKYYATRPDLTKTLYDTLAIRGSRKREEAFEKRVLK